MKKIIFFLTLLCSTTLFADGLIGSWHTFTSGQNYAVTIDKTNVYRLIMREKGDYKSVIYATDESSYNYNNSNFMAFQAVMRPSVGGESSDLPNSCSITFLAEDGDVQEIKLLLGGTYYWLERDEESKQTTRQVTSSSNTTSSTTQTSYSSQSNTYSAPRETRIQNINVTYGWAGEWIFQFTPYGTFRHHEFTSDSYGRKIREIGVQSGTYYLTEDERGVVRVYLRYESGRKKTGIIRYSSSSSELSIDGKRRVEIRTL